MVSKKKKKDHLELRFQFDESRRHFWKNLANSTIVKIKNLKTLMSLIWKWWIWDSSRRVARIYQFNLMSSEDISENFGEVHSLWKSKIWKFLWVPTQYVESGTHLGELKESLLEESQFLVLTMSTGLPAQDQ